MFRYQVAASFILECLFVAVSYATISVIPTNQYVNAGEDITLTCTSDKATGWSFEAIGTTTPTGITETDTTQRIHIDSTGGKLNLVIRSATTTDAGIYRCVDTDGNKGAYLTVFDSVPTNAAQVTAGQEYTNGDTFMTTCSATYTAKSEVEVVIEASSGEIATSDSGSITLTGLSVTIQNNNFSQYCEFYFNVTKASVELDESDTPRQKISPTGVQVSFCAEIPTITPDQQQYSPNDMLTCSSAGFPAPTYKWYDNNNNVIATTSGVTVPSTGVTSLKCEASNTLTSVTCTPTSKTINVNLDVVTTTTPAKMVTQSNPAMTLPNANDADKPLGIGEVPTSVTVLVGTFGGVLVVVVIIQFLQSAQATGVAAVGHAAPPVMQQMGGLGGFQQIHYMRQMQPMHRVPQNMYQIRPPRQMPPRMGRFYM